MNTEIIEFLQHEKIGVIALEMLDGSPHGATVKFAFSPDPLVFIFETNRNYKKCEALFGRPESRASLVVGTNLGDMKTLQLDGIAKLVTDQVIKEMYLSRFPENRKWTDDSDTVYFSFIPSTWKFSEYKFSGGKKVVTSDGKVTILDY
jgi:hypothetical protein